MKHNKNIGILLVVVMGLMLMSGFVMAAECSGQDCSADADVTVDNAAPTIGTVNAPASITLNGGTTKVVIVNFTATDTNGVGDLNDSTAQVTLSKAGETDRSSTVACSILSSSGTDTEYSCSITMQFYDGAGSWNVNASVEDNTGVLVYNDSQSSTVNALDYITQDVTSVSWSSVSVGTNDAESTAPIVLTNGGNQDYSNVSIKGYGATGTTYSDTIAANLFSVDDQTGQTTGQTYMSSGVYVQATQLTGLNTHGAAVTENIYFYLDVPNVAPDTYNSDTTWSILVSA